jgi:aryl-alcohol dehydrogenase-like predicted oxidoreductase
VAPLNELLADGPRIGLGLAALGRPSYLTVGHAADVGGHPDQDTLRRHAHGVLDAAWQGGIRYYDAARSYGRAEAFLAAWLTERDVPPRAAVVASKWGYTYTAGWDPKPATHEIKDHSAAAFDRQLAETETHLGRWLAVYQIHSATLETGVLDDGAVLDRLWGLRRRGIAVGLSTSGPRQSETIRRAMAIDDGAGTRLFAAVQATWNLLERSAAPALTAAAEVGMAVIVKEALANGRLGPRGSSAWRPEGEGAPYGPDAVALAAAAAQPWATVVLSGAATASQVADNLAANDVPAAVVDAALNATAPEAPERYWETRSRLAWT